MHELLTLEEALGRILAHVRPMPSETVSLSEATGRVLAEPGRAAVDLPPFPSSAMDGFAVRASDTPGTLPIAYRVRAGAPATDPLPARSAAAIATGGVIPEGADAVIPVEDVIEHDSHVEISGAPRPGAHIRPRGGDVAAGATVVDSGVRLGPAQIGALTASGVADVQCSCRPRVAVLATGSELRVPGERLEPGEIFESNRLMIAAVLTRTAAEVQVLEVVPDDECAHRAALERGLEADVLVTSGGVSMGERDLVRDVLRELGVTEVFWGVAVKPGKPLSFGVRGSTLVFGLPGNPVSALVGSLVFVLPALDAAQGVHDPGPAYDIGRAVADLARDSHRDTFLRARRHVAPEGATLEPVRGQESHMIVRAAAADSLVHVPRGEGVVAAGELVRYLRLA